MPTGGQLVVQTLRNLGTEIIFSISGNQILPVFDAAPDAGLRIIHMRHESAAAYAAAGLAELREDQPGVVLTSAGPGYLAALTGVATTKSLELPVLLLSGACARSEAGAGGFQDVDQCGIARVTCKDSLNVAAVDQIPQALTEAWRIAQASVPGPVHVNLPADLLAAEGPSASIQDPQSSTDTVSNTSVLDAMAEQLTRARRPLIIARPSANRGSTGHSLRRLAHQLGIEPIITESPRGFSDPKYLDVARHYRDCDCLLAVCPADFAVGFLAKSVIAEQGVLLQIDAPSDPPPRRIPDLHSQAPIRSALPYLAKQTEGHAAQASAWSELWSPAVGFETTAYSSGQGLHPLDVAKEVREILCPNDVVVLDGGEFCQWIRLGLRHVKNRIVWNSKLGGIGGGIPLAIGAAMSSHSGRTFCFVGDGAFGYHAIEFETATRYQVPIVVIVGNDARWGAEWHLQAAKYGPTRTFATSLSNARYDLVSSGLGAQGFAIADRDTLRNALSAACSSRPVCLDIKIQSLRSPAQAHAVG